MEKRKILIIIGALCVGGAEQVARDIGLQADREGYLFDYLVFSETEGAYEAPLKDAGCRILRTKEPSEDYPGYIKWLWRLLSEEKYHAVHAHTMFSCGIAMALAKLAGVPLRIAHAHSALAEGGGVGRKLYEWVSRGLIRCCATDLVACGGQAGRRLFGNDPRVQYIPNGIDTGAFRFSRETRQTVRRELGLEGLVLGHVGHLNSVKNQMFLLQLLPSLLEKRQDIHLLLLGEGEMRPALEETIRKLGLQNHVTLTGNVANVADYLNAMDVFAFPSLYEGMPLALLEAQTNGLPCLVSDRVPEDAFVTELVQTLPLEEPERWIDGIRKAPIRADDTAGTVFPGWDASVAMAQVYRIYERECDDEKAAVFH